MITGLEILLSTLQTADLQAMWYVVYTYYEINDN